MNDLTLFGIIFVCNIIGAVIYFLMVWQKKKDLARALMGSLIIVCTFGFGMFFFIMSYLWYRLFSSHFSKDISLEDLSFRQDKEHYYMMEDIQLARDKVPIEESVMVANKDTARSYLLNILRDDYKKYIEAINYAAGSKDSEISHYAATAVVDNIARFKAEITAYRNGGNDIEAEDFVEGAVSFLVMDILSENDCRYYTDQIEEIAGKTQQSDTILYSMVRLYLYLNRMDMAEKWIGKIRPYPDKTIQAYKAQLNYYFTRKEKDHFLEILNELKKSDIALDQQTMELVRMF